MAGSLTFDARPELGRARLADLATESSNRRVSRPELGVAMCKRVVCLATRSLKVPTCILGMLQQPTPGFYASQMAMLPSNGSMVLDRGEKPTSMSCPNLCPSNRLASVESAQRHLGPLNREQ